MADSFKAKRAIFPSGKQRGFLEQVGLRLTTASIAHISKCSERAVRDWRREKFSMPLTTVRALAIGAHVPMPRYIRTRDAYAHTSRAGKMGWATIMKKYGRIPGDEKRRKKRWTLWWKTIGESKKNPILRAKDIYKPKRDAELAEFVGIMMGDGGISNYQITVTLHHIDDMEYSQFVTNLIQKLFKVAPSVYHSPKESVNDIVVSRKELVRYLHALGLPIGNKVKQQFDIPKWIKSNRKLSIACVRGLVDTDGSVFTHRYKVRGKEYEYKKLSFTSASGPLRKSVHTLLCNFGLHPRLTNNDVRLDSVEDMRQYFLHVGSHNPKHLRRYGNTVG